jgi:hypothetical protein
VKPIPHYTPINPPRVKSSASKASDSVIFNSLKTPEKNGKKFVAGLTCTVSKCSLAEKGSKEYDDYSIYIAITTKPKDVTSPLITGSKTFQKQAGRLTCTETVTKAAKSTKPLASYSCKLGWAKGIFIASFPVMSNVMERPPEIIPPNTPQVPERASPDQPEIYPQKSPEIQPDREPFEFPDQPEPDRGPEISPPEIFPRWVWGLAFFRA